MLESPGTGALRAGEVGGRRSGGGRGHERIVTVMVAGADTLPALSTAWTLTWTVAPQGRSRIRATLVETVPTVTPSWLTT